MRRSWMTLLVVALAATSVAAADWPQFDGPNRDGISAETGLLKNWPGEGPPELWSFEIGEGFSSVAVVGNRVYATGFLGGNLMVTALDTSGKKLWQEKADKAGGGGGKKGSRSTPTVDGDRLYLLSEDGLLVCMKTDDGKEVWSKNILKEYGAPNITWRLAESPLVDKDNVIVTPGGPKASMVALNKMTGAQVWAAKPIVATWTDRRSKEEKTGPDATSYSSARIIEFGGVRQAINFTGHTVFAVNADTGELLWDLPHHTSYDVNATSVVFDKGMLFITSGYGSGSEGIKLTASGGKIEAKQAWKSKDLDDHFGGVVLVGGKVYGTAFRGGLVSIDLATGKTVYKKGDVKKSSVIYADGFLYCQGHDGIVQLVRPSDGAMVSSFPITIQRAGMMWAHPAIADGKLYIHHDATLTCYDIKAK